MGPAVSVAALATLTLLLVGSVWGGALTASPQVRDPSTGAPSVASGSHAGAASAATAAPAAPRPTASGPPLPTTTGRPGTYYVQEGASFLQVAGSASNYFTHLSETFVLPAASTPTSYELNGVTSTGDWVQLSISDYWPFANLCPVPEYTLSYELWDDAKNSISTGLDWWENGFCSQAFTPHLGDSIELSMSLNCLAGGTGSVCMTYTDLTQDVQAVNLQPQPSFQEHGLVGTYFVNAGSPLVTSNHYFVGPATESIVLVALSCPTVVEPTVSYVMNSEDNLPITQYYAWADEYDYFTGENCYTPVATVVSVSASDPTTTYTTFSGSSPFGTRTIAGQNWTAAENFLGGSTPFYEYRFETDPPLPSFSFTVNPSVVDAYQGFEVLSSARAPEICSWTVAGPGPAVFPHPAGSCSWSGYASRTTENAVAGLLVSADDNMVQRSVPLTVVADPLVDLAATPSPVDEYAPVTLTASVTLHAGDRVAGYDWAGLPAGCRGASTRGTLTCTPTAVGTFNVSVDVTDTNGYTHGNVTTLTVEDPCGTPGACFHATFTGPVNLPWRAFLLTTCKLCPGEARIYPISGSKAGNVSFLVPNGTYQYLVEGSAGFRVLKLAPFGNLTVGGADRSMAIDLGKGSTPTLKLSAKGLPKGVPWCLTIGWTSCTSNRTLTIRNLTSGAYPYTLSAPDGFLLKASDAGSSIGLSGTLDLLARSAHLQLGFQSVTDAVTFNETGLPTGAKWCLDVVHAKKVCSTKPELVLAEPNGSLLYSWTTTEKGYEGGSGALEVEGAALNRSLLFVVESGLSPAVSSLGPGEAGARSPVTPALATVGGIASASLLAFCGVGAFSALQRGRRGRRRRQG
ncbi:MAG TPA: hypothetical protein VMH38_03850 [Thermoplasmata archaeon]|nr:hypothetical protein [Thermoplasmata archaeon]